MRCEEIQEYLVELLYDESDTLNPEIQSHLSTCLACRREYEELKQTRKYLQTWKDESPLRNLSIVDQKTNRDRNKWRFVRYAAIAAMVVICFLALANTQVTLNKSGFSFSTHLFERRTPERDYYTKSETREIMKRAMQENEELSHLMVQQLLDTVERGRWMDAHYYEARSAQNKNKN
jgi:hypothetical protein